MLEDKFLGALTNEKFDGISVLNAKITILNKIKVSSIVFFLFW